MVLAGAGRRLELPDTLAVATPEIHRLQVKIAQLFSQLHVSRLISSAAAGSDLLLISEAMSQGAECEIFLPFDAESFRRESVVDRGLAWGSAFDAALNYKRSTDHNDKENTSDPFVATNIAIIERAKAGDVDRCAVAIWDKQRRSAMDYTAHFVQQARINNIKLFDIVMRSKIR